MGRVGANTERAADLRQMERLRTLPGMRVCRVNFWPLGMLLWMAAVTGVCAQEQSALAVDGVGQVPLMAGAGPREDVATSLTREAAARRAMQMGFPHVAAGILEQLVAEGEQRRGRMSCGWSGRWLCSKRMMWRARRRLYRE